MAALEDFENTLNEVVGAKRLSASKMNKLTEIAMKSLEDDTKLVAILYRTHNSSPSSAKVSSLYAFDALARAAKSLVSKRGVVGDVNSAKGNAATFLLKMEGVLDGLFRDMASLDNAEAKDKTKKVLDIWVKSNTFPPTAQTRLRDILSDVRKENTVNPTPTTIPPPIPDVPTTPQSAASDVQATLLALLGQAAQGPSQPNQMPPNTDPQLHLALLQQLALTAKLASNSPTPPGQSPPPAESNPPPVPNPPLEPSQLPPRPPQTGVPGDPRFTRNGYPDRARDPRDDRQMRGGARSGFRGRGRGRWDDHPSQDRFRPRDRDLLPRSRNSRSRSPRRQVEQRHVRPYSPSRRPLQDPDADFPGTPPATNTHDKDEFGRDLRATTPSPSRSASAEDTQTLSPMDSSVDPRIPVSEPLGLVAASTSAQSTETDTPTQPGLDRFDINTFDATSPSSWEALGNMWKTSHGHPPSQEALMHFVMAESMAVAAGLGNGGFNGAQGGQWQQGTWPGRSGGWQEEYVTEQSDTVV